MNVVNMEGNSGGINSYLPEHNRSVEVS